jgi:hypothetical protein
MDSIRILMFNLAAVPNDAMSRQMKSEAEPVIWILVRYLVVRASGP